MQRLPTPITVGAGASILATTWAAGMGTAFSLFDIPAYIQNGANAEVMIRQWRFMFLRGQAIIPTVGALNALNFGFVAYSSWSRGLEWRGFAAGGLSTFFIIPYTLLFIMGTNARLLQAGKAIDSGKKVPLSDDEAKGLIKKWGQLNVVRVVVPLVGAGFALWNYLL